MSGRNDRSSARAPRTGRIDNLKGMALLAGGAIWLKGKAMVDAIDIVAATTPQERRAQSNREAEPPFNPTPHSAVKSQITTSSGSNVIPLLSPREREVAALMAEGYTNRQIAEELFISIATAERHASNIFNKLGVRSRTRVAVWAIETGLVLSRAS